MKEKYYLYSTEHVKKKLGIKMHLISIMIIIAVSNINRFFTSIHPALHIFTFFIILNLFYLFATIVLRNVSFKVYNASILFFLCLLSYLLIGTLQSNPIDNMGIALGIVQNIMIVFILIYSIRENFEFIFLLKVIECTGFILGVLGILEFFNIFHIMKLVDGYVYYYGNRIGVTWINPNSYGMALVFCLVCNLTLNINIKRLIKRAIIILGIIISMSRSAVVVTVIILIASFIYKKRKYRINTKNILKVLIFLLLFLVLLDQLIKVDCIRYYIMNSRIMRIFRFKDENSDDISNGRIAAALNALNIIKENWLMGIGIKNIPDYTDITQSAHNIYLNIWAESGIIPFIFYVSYIYSLFMIVKKRCLEDNYQLLAINLFIFIFVYGLFSHTLLTNPITGISTALILLKEKLIYNSEEGDSFLS